MSGPIESLLVPLDGSERSEHAIAVAVRLGTLCGAPITLFHWNFDREEADAIGERMSALAERLGPTTNVVVEVNDDLLASLAMATAPRRATVCMTTHGRGGLGRAVLGSVAEDVLRRTNRPLVLVGPRAQVNGPGPAGRVVVGLDGSPEAEQALTVAAAWGAQLGADLELVHALEPASGGVPEPDGDVVDSGYLMGLAKTVRTSRPPSFEVLHGRAEKALVEYGADGVELLALSTHGRSGLQRLALGSVTMGVAHRAHRPLLVVPRP